MNNKIYTRTFRVRYYECDSYGHVNNVNYLRYMQEAAFDAGAAVGYDLHHFELTRHIWLVRETEIEYLRPLRYGDSVTVKTWVEDFRRTRSQRAYELIHEASGETAARAKTDWVYLDSATLHPMTVPPEMRLAFGISPTQDAGPRLKFPSAPPQPAGVFKMRRPVQFRDLDPMHHVNNAVYLDYVSDCGMQALEAHGWSLPRMEAAGFGILIKRHQIEYRQSAVMGDELEIATWASGVRRASALRHYTIHRVGDGELLAQVRSQGVWIDLSSGSPIRIPPDFIADFAPNIADPSAPTARG